MRAARPACRASVASRSKAYRCTWIRRSSSSEMSPFSARRRWMRSTSSSVRRFCSASASVACATSTSLNAFLTCAMTWRRTSSSSSVVTRVAALALARRRSRLPPVSIGWARVIVCCTTASPPPGSCSVEYDAVGFGRSPAVISLARVDWTSYSLARNVGLCRNATATASSSDTAVSVSCPAACDAVNNARITMNMNEPLTMRLPRK